MEINDDYMRQRLGQMRHYPLALLKKGPSYQPHAHRSPEHSATIWEHGRRNMRLQKEGKMALVGPVSGESDIVGICVFTCEAEAARMLLETDDAVVAGVLTFEILTWFTSPGDGLPDAA